MKVAIFVNKNPYLCLGIILVQAFGLRFYKIDAHGLAGDEKYSLFVSQFVTYEGNNQHDSVRKPNDKYFTPQEFWSEKKLPYFFDSIARLDTGNGALYTYSLHYWTQIFGVSDLSMRFPSLLFNLLTIILLFIFVKEHFQSPNMALLAAFLAAISPFYIAYAQVARNYSLNMFFALLATHLLLKILQEEESDNKPIRKYIFYGFSVLACELCHLATFPLFLIHALYVLVFFRKIRPYFGFAFAMIIPLIGLVLWLNSDGGKWISDYVTNSVKVYNQMARSTPDEYLNITTLKNILKQIRHVISATFLAIDGYPSLSVLYKKTYLFIVISSVASLLMFLYQTMKLKDKQEKKLRFFIILLGFVPLLALIAFAYQDGNTFRIIPRYLAYSYGFNLILICLIIRDLCSIKLFVKYGFYTIFLANIFIISQLINNVWNDTAPRYFMYFAEPRTRNPYELLARNIEQTYAKGDTVLYPSIFVEKNGGLNMPTYSVSDAQLTNFYLPKNATIIQRVNIFEENKVILKKANGNQEVLFDFQGTKYRY